MWAFLEVPNHLQCCVSLLRGHTVNYYLPHWPNSLARMQGGPIQRMELSLLFLICYVWLMRESREALVLNAKRDVQETTRTGNNTHVCRPRTAVNIDASSYLKCVCHTPAGRHRVWCQRLTPESGGPAGNTIHKGAGQAGSRGFSQQGQLDGPRIKPKKCIHS